LGPLPRSARSAGRTTSISIGCSRRSRSRSAIRPGRRRHSRPGSASTRRTRSSKEWRTSSRTGHLEATTMYPDAPARTLPDRAGPGLPVKGDAAMPRRSIGELRRPAAAVAVLAVLVYANSLFNGFALDDVPIIAENARVHRLLALRDIWLTPYWPTFGEDLGLYRPLMIFLYAVEWMLGGGRPMLFHAVNVLGHAAASVLALLLLARLVPERPAF